MIELPSGKPSRRRRKSSLVNFLMKTILRKHSYDLLNPQSYDILPPPPTSYDNLSSPPGCKMMIKYDIPLPNFTTNKGSIPTIDSIDNKPDKHIWDQDTPSQLRVKDDQHLYAEINKHRKRDTITDDPRHLYAEVNKLTKTRNRRPATHLYEEINTLSNTQQHHQQQQQQQQQDDVFDELNAEEVNTFEGYLFVYNRSFWRLSKHAWKQKYFILRGDTLYIADSKNDTPRQLEYLKIGLDTGIYPTDNEVITSGEPRYGIRVTCGKQTYTLGTMDVDVRDTWVTSLLISMSNIFLQMAAMSPSLHRRDGD